MRLVFLGTGEFAVPALRALANAGHDVAVALSQPDRPAGRGRKLRPTAVRAAAEELRIRHVQTENVNAPELRGLLAGVDIAVVAAFGQKIGRALLDAFPRGCVNIHGSLLPKYRGAAPFQWAILNGDTRTGVTVFQLDEAWDAGPVWATRETTIGDTQTADELHDRLALLGAELIVDTFPIIERGDTQPQTQDADAATFAPKLSRSDGVVDWTQCAKKIVRRIHALWSWPTATCKFVSRSGKSERLQLARAEVVDPDASADDAHPAGGFRADGTLQTGQGRVRLLEVKPAGGKLMSFVAFANGRQVAPPDRLLPLDAP